MLIKMDFIEKLSDIKPSLDTLQNGMRGKIDIVDQCIKQFHAELLECGSLREICYVALITGNIINGVSKVTTNLITCFSPIREEGQGMLMDSN